MSAAAPSRAIARLRQLSRDYRTRLRIIAAGALITLLLVTLDMRGGLAPLENLLYDARARHCQRFTPPPTTQLVHLDIDDPAIESIGRWPWSRKVLAEMLEEVRLAGAKAVAFDVIFPEPEPPIVERVGDADAARPGPVVSATTTTAAATGPAPGRAVAVIEEFEPDELFARAIARAGNVTVPVSVTLEEPAVPMKRAVVAELSEDLEMSDEEVVQRLAKSAQFGGGAEALRRRVQNVWYEALDEAMFVKLRAVPNVEQMSLDQLWQQLLPRSYAADKTDAGGAAGARAIDVRLPIVRLLERRLRAVVAARRLRSFTRSVPDDLPSAPTADHERLTIAPLLQAAHRSGFVDYLPTDDGVVRAIPLWVNHRGRLLPQMGFAFACDMLGVDVNDASHVMLYRDRVSVITPTGQRFDIPVFTQDTPAGTRGMFMHIPWVGGRDWRSMYGFDEGGRPRQHLSINAVWAICFTRQKLQTNNRTCDRALILMWDAWLNRREQADALRNRPPPPDDYAGRAAWVNQALADGKDFYDELRAMPGERKADEAALEEAYGALQRVAAVNPKLLAQLAEARSFLATHVNDRAVMIGGLGSASSDRVPTSLHAGCPGSVVQGAVFNAVATRHFRSQAPRWVGVLVTLGFGLIVTFAVALWTPLPATITALVIAGGYAVVNALVLFDYAGTVLNLSTPLLAVSMVLGVGSLLRWFLEVRDARRLLPYLDPSLAKYAREHPQMRRFEGRLAEVTVGFTDLAGFTTLSEQLREETVDLLGKYLAAMVPVIRRNRGYVNKFIGDGIMFFFGALEPDEAHALHGIAAALEMHEALAEFNRRNANDGVPALTMRTGVNTGVMVVGDSGPADACDFTVLGDAVNSAARLETANKAFETRILIGPRTYELVQGDYLCCPVGKIRVAGKQKAIFVYEPLVKKAAATEAQQNLVACMERLVELYQAGRFHDCRAACESAEPALGELKLLRVYHALSTRYAASPPDDFLGAIELTER